jgi:hypothetical protein
MIIERKISKKLLEMAKKYPVVALTGPRQSGKTTLVRYLFPDKKYISMENPDVREFALTDPKGFLATYDQGAIIDEVQRTPELFSYIQTMVDEKKIMGQYILTGSQNFLLLESITQSLAGRVAILKLLPFSHAEIRDVVSGFNGYEDILVTGCYPSIYDRDILPGDYYPNYIQTYLERDVRSIQNIHDLNTFQTFIKLCAGRIGQLLNLSSLAADCGISQPTVRQWLTILEASYIVYRIQPHHRNFNKRLVKMPKLYFYDTGLASSLLSIRSAEQVFTHYLRGSLFENLIVSEFIKSYYNAGREHSLYFWRDKNGNEIDVLIEDGMDLIPVEIKSGKTVADDYFSGLLYWKSLTGLNQGGYLVYGGFEAQKRSHGTVVPWNRLELVPMHRKKIV